MSSHVQSQQQSGLFAKFAALITGSMLISSFGTYVGAGITSVVAIIVLACLFLFGSIGVRIAARANPGAGLVALGIWLFITGLFMGPTIAHYVHVLGLQMVLFSYLATAAVMAICGCVGALSGINFSALGRWLFIALLGLIVVSIIGIFVTFGSLLTIIVGCLGMVVFAGFFMYDFWVMQELAKNGQDDWATAIDVTMNVFVDYINFQLYLLQVLAALFGKKD